jgi:hypothetical protein
MSSDKKSTPAAAAAGGRSQVTGVKLGKGARRALTKNADCVDEFLSIVSSSPTASYLAVALEKESLQLARVERSTGCGRLQVTLQDGTTGVSVPISGTIKFKGRSNTKTDRANCMCADDMIVIRGSFASAKVSPAAAAFIRKHYEAKGIKTPRGFFSSAVEEEEEKQMGGNVGGGGGFEFDRDDELAGEEAEVAALRAQNARAIALRTGKAVSVDSEDSDVDIENI